jgi:DNA-binding transcriptional ArsR family regulator
MNVVQRQADGEPQTRELAAAAQGDCPLIEPLAEELELTAVLHALSDPVRLSVVARLSQGGECPCGGFELPVGKSTCTHHLRVLRQAGVIRQRVEGKTRLNALRRADLDRRFPGLLDAVLGAAREPR